jgi:hypothetical protein
VIIREGEDILYSPYSVNDIHGGLIAQFNVSIAKSAFNATNGNVDWHSKFISVRAWTHI